MTRYGVRTDFERAGSISHPTPIHSHLDNFGFDFWFVGQVGVVPKETLFTGKTTIALCAFGCSPVPFLQALIPRNENTVLLQVPFESKITNSTR